MAEIKMMCDVSLESTKVCTVPACPNCNSNSVVYDNYTGWYKCTDCNKIFAGK